MAARWLTRGDLGAAGGSATGLLLVAPDLSGVFPLDPADRTACVRMTGEVLEAVGVGAADRVVVALAEPAATLWTSAAADVAAAAASVGPRGRMRLHHALTTLRATALVATPTGVMDFLARLHLEFLLDPLDLGLRHIVLTGEIASKHTMHTVGEHVLVRGVWVSLPRLDKALSKIDGVSGWELTISRAGTLDSAVLTVTFGRRSLVANPMWKSRIQEALRALTPVTIGVEIAPEAAEAARRGLANDLRGQHLGRDRALLT